MADLHAASWRLAYRGALSDAYLAGDIVADRRQVWASRLSSPLPRQRVFVCEESGVMRGFACAYLQEDAQWGCLLDNIHVGASAQRQGLGSRLLGAVAESCAALTPASGLYLWVLQGNEVAQKFYRAHGAQNVGSDVWAAPGGTQVPRFRLAWPAGALPGPQGVCPGGEGGAS